MAVPLAAKGHHPDLDRLPGLGSDVVAKRRGLPAEDFVPKGMLRAYNERKARGPVEGAH